jgi:hypothetical protein
MNMTIQSSCAWSYGSTSGTINRSGNNVSFTAPFQGTPVNNQCQGGNNTATFNGVINSSGSSQSITGSYAFPNNYGGNFQMNKSTN